MINQKDRPANIAESLPPLLSKLLDALKISNGRVRSIFIFYL